MTEPWGIFDSRAEYDPAGDWDAFLAAVPAKWVVYLFADADDRPVQLLCVRNLRASLKRRLGTDEPIGPTRKVNYRQIVRRVYWRRVDNTFEADWLYVEAARTLFPETYRGMMGFRPAWFVHVNPDAPFPRYVRTQDPSIGPGWLIGPVEDKHATGRLIQLVEDCFDLCRYYNILIDAPRGRACAYKEMGRCPAPCDGSISMEQYRDMIERSAQVLVDPQPYAKAQEQRMTQAAAELRFEAAGRIKAHMKQLAQFGQGPFRHARRLADFRFLSLQRGPRNGLAKMYLITPGRIETIGGLIDRPEGASDLLRFVLAAADEAAFDPTDPAAVDRIAVASHHLFAPKKSQGVFIFLAEVDDRALTRGYNDLLKQKPQAQETEAEGLDRELQAM